MLPYYYNYYYYYFYYYHYHTKHVKFRCFHDVQLSNKHLMRSRTYVYMNIYLEERKKR